jgi:hypothetical protein
MACTTRSSKIVAADWQAADVAAAKHEREMLLLAWASWDADERVRKDDHDH